MDGSYLVFISHEMDLLASSIVSGFFDVVFWLFRPLIAMDLRGCIVLSMMSLNMLTSIRMWNSLRRTRAGDMLCCFPGPCLVSVEHMFLLQEMISWYTQYEHVNMMCYSRMEVRLWHVACGWSLVHWVNYIDRRPQIPKNWHILCLLNDDSFTSLTVTSRRNQELLANNDYAGAKVLRG